MSKKARLEVKDVDVRRFSIYLEGKGSQSLTSRRSLFLGVKKIKESEGKVRGEKEALPPFCQICRDRGKEKNRDDSFLCLHPFWKDQRER